MGPYLCLRTCDQSAEGIAIIPNLAPHTFLHPGGKSLFQVEDRGAK